MKIAYGNSRMEKRWKNNEISWDDFCKRVSTTQTTTETVEEYRKMTKPQQDAVKDVGGFVGGHLRGGRRKTGTVLCRSMLTLDMDHGTPDILDELSLLNSHELCVYSTHKHTPEAPRLRLIFPLKRDVSEEEYPALARKVAQEIGMDLFDDTTYQPHRLMYWPSTSRRFHLAGIVQRIGSGKKSRETAGGPACKDRRGGGVLPYLPDPGSDRKVPAGCLRAVGDGRKV